MEDQGFESDDEFQQMYGSLNRNSATSLASSNTLVARDVPSIAVSEENAAMPSSPLEPQRPSIFSPSTEVLSSSQTPILPALRSISEPLISAVPLASIAGPVSISTPRARFLDQEVALLADDAHPPAEKDGDDPTTPLDADSSAHTREYSTPTSLARLLASHSAESPTDSRAPSYTLGNGNLVRRCKSIVP
jgi:hypothetical protein